MRPSLEAFVQEWDPLVRRLARQLLSRYSGWFKDPDNEIDDLMQVGRLRLVSLHVQDKVNFQRQGYKSFVYQSIHGVMLNYIGKNIPSIASDMLIHQISLDSELNHLPSNEAFNDDVYLEDLITRSTILSIITEFMETLSPREQLILVAKICDKKTDLDISQCLGGGRSHITETFNDLIRKLVLFVRKRQGWDIDVSDMKSYLKEIQI